MTLFNDEISFTLNFMVEDCDSTWNLFHGIENWKPNNSLPGDRALWDRHRIFLRASGINLAALYSTDRLVTIRVQHCFSIKRTSSETLLTSFKIATAPISFIPSRNALVTACSPTAMRPSNTFWLKFYSNLELSQLVMLRSPFYRTNFWIC